MRTILAAWLLALAGAACAQSAEVPNADPLAEQRLKDLAAELRCLVCQNQTIADSNAPLAVDLRQQIRTQITQGRSDAQIRGYMVERYGDFVLYKPPLKASTALLWGAPFVLLAAGAGIFFMVVRRKRPATGAGELPRERQDAIRDLLEKD